MLINMDLWLNESRNVLKVIQLNFVLRYLGVIYFEVY